MHPSAAQTDYRHNRCRIVNFTARAYPSRELFKYLQEWVWSTPTVNIEGVHLHISNCSVHLNEHELGSTEANCTEPAGQSAGQSAVRISIAITTSALVVIIIMASTIICSVYCWRKRTITEDKRYEYILLFSQNWDENLPRMK